MFSLRTNTENMFTDTWRDRKRWRYLNHPAIFSFFQIFFAKLKHILGWHSVTFGLAWFDTEWLRRLDCVTEMIKAQVGLITLLPIFVNDAFVNQWVKIVLMQCWQCLFIQTGNKFKLSMPFYVATLYLFRFISHFIFWQHCADGLVGFRNKNPPGWVRKKTMFWLKHLVFSPQTWPEMSFLFVLWDGLLSKISTGFTLSNVDTQSRTVVSGFPAFLPILKLHHHHPRTPCLWYDTFCMNVNVVCSLWHKQMCTYQCFILANGLFNVIIKYSN